jgi:hypothetical protein
VIESSHKQESWFSLEGIEKSSESAWLARLLIRWNEQIVTRQDEMGGRVEYVYESHRFPYALPIGVHDHAEAISFLENAKLGIIAAAQEQAAQEVGFYGQ